MSDILNIYTSEQLYTMFRNKVLADLVGLTDFNEGSKNRSLLEAQSEIISAISMDFKESLYKAIPIALYVGFGFAKTAAVAATGYLRPYRLPLFTISYSGSGTSVLITSSSTQIASVCTGAGGDNFTLAYASYATTSDLVDAINALSNWSATLVSDVDSDLIYQYTSVELIGETDYTNTSGMDIMLATDTAITVTSGFSATVDDLQFVTTAEGTIAAGESSATIAAECASTGTDGNIAVNAIDTANGKGFISSNIDGIEQVINDSAFSGGEAAETDTERQTRFTETVNALNAGTELGIINEIKKITSVRSVGMRTSYPFKGTNTIIVDDGTQTLSSTLLAAVELRLYGDPDDLTNYPGKNAEGIGYVIVAPTIVNVDINITVYRFPSVNVDLDDIETDAQTAIEQYINTLPLGSDVVLSEVVRVTKNSNAAIWDCRITNHTSNIVVGEEEFAKTGSGTSGTVTVTPVVATEI